VLNKPKLRKEGPEPGRFLPEPRDLVPQEQKTGDAEETKDYSAPVEVNRRPKQTSRALEGGLGINKIRSRRTKKEGKNT